MTVSASRVLVSTLPMLGGGVHSITMTTLKWLREGGLEPVVAYYQPYSIDPGLSVPSFMLGRRRAEARVRHLEGVETHEIGAWLPELEFMHYQPTRLWRSVVRSCQFHIAVSGSCLAALPLARSGLPFLNWVSTPWREDRRQREEHFPLVRRFVDRCLVRPVTTRIEREILARGTLLALSHHTKASLEHLLGRPAVMEVLPSPIDTNLFRPEPSGPVPWRVGLAGRLSDPRKNVRLFIETVAECRRRGHPITALLVGSSLSPSDENLVSQLGLTGVLNVVPHVVRESLPGLLSTFDAYFVSSRQEGLCIAALEAMACGCPVVSTRCGGPEEFVREAETGYLVGFEARAAADAIERICGDRATRTRLSTAARAVARLEYGEERTRSTFWRAFEKTFPGASVSRLD